MLNFLTLKFFFLFFKIFIYLFLAFLVFITEYGLSLVARHGLLIEMASLAAEQGL